MIPISSKAALVPIWLDVVIKPAGIIVIKRSQRISNARMSGSSRPFQWLRRRIAGLPDWQKMSCKVGLGAELAVEGPAGISPGHGKVVNDGGLIGCRLDREPVRCAFSNRYGGQGLVVYEQTHLALGTAQEDTIPGEDEGGLLDAGSCSAGGGTVSPRETDANE